MRGWPTVMRSDPGSQLEAASGKLEKWWGTMGDSVMDLAGQGNFRWDITPADSPWRQGRAERKIGIIKRLLKISVGDSRIIPLELQPALFEIASNCNEMPISIGAPREDGSYAVLTANNLMLGRSSKSPPDDSQIADELGAASIYRIINYLTYSFWEKWSQIVSPSLVTRQRWHGDSQ